MGLYIGLMSGTSMDAVDAALVDIEADTCRLIAQHNQPIPPPLGQRLQRLIQSETFEVRELGSLDVEIGRLFAAAANRLLQQTHIDKGGIEAIGSHGQTVFHAPDSEPPFTLQIGDPNTIAQLTGITTVADLRRRDMVVGGQGAPLATAFHNHHFRSPDHDRVILNIGGIANITVLPAEPQAPVLGLDTGPGNCLMDDWIRQQRGEPYDSDGHWGAGGRVDEALLSRLLADPYFARAAPKSTGREYFHLSWLARHQADEASPQDVQATLAALTIESISRAIERFAPDTQEVFVCGGGAYNALLLQGLKGRLAQMRVDTSAALGVPPEWVEAAAFAWLAQQTLARRPGNLIEVTGAAEPVILGGIYPGSSFRP